MTGNGEKIKMGKICKKYDLFSPNFGPLNNLVSPGKNPGSDESPLPDLFLC